MSLLTMISDTSKLLGLGARTSVVSSPDPLVMAMLAQANVEGVELAKRYDWSTLVREANWTTLAAESQGTLASIAPDLDQEQGARIINETIWNRSNQRRITGPVSSPKWQRMKAASVTGPYSEYRIRAGNLYLLPQPPAGQNGYFEYVSKNWCQSSGATGQSAWAADTDTGVISEHLMKLGVVWRFKQSKEMSWEPDYQIYNAAVVQSISRDGTRETLNMGEAEPYRPTDAVTVPEGSWNLP